MRIATGGIVHETSTFAKSPTTVHEFENDRGGILRGEKVIEHCRDTNLCTGGFIQAAEQEGFELIPLLRTEAFPGGLIPRADYESLKNEMLQRLTEEVAAHGPVDGVLLDLHGAMVVEGIEDGDGDLIASFRQALGPDRPLIATFDLHGNHTPKRVDNASAVIGFDTYPHVDMAERGLEAGIMMARTVRGEIRPVSAIYQIPMFWGTAHQVTAHPPMNEAMALVHSIEERPGILSVTLATGFPWADVPDVGTSVMVVADGDRELAQKTADELGAWVWERRQTWYAPPVSVKDALAAGEESGKYPIMLADHSDNTGGGAPGDSTEVLRTFLEMNLSDALLLYLVDPDVAQQATKAGIGSTITVTLGGKSDPIQGPPVQAEAEVVALTNGDFAYDGPMFAGLRGNMGTSAWIRIGGTSVVVVTQREQPFDQAFARSLGIECAKMKYICVKSAAHFRSGFESIAGSIHNVDAAAIQTHDYRQLKYHKRERGVFPIEIPPTE